ncbi:unnamed protein product [Effrenium voratum]|uniref:ABC1 atypical kinase-like domain-containing protein n=1 Tax=Effrenium voratum TaxID=2562239 RepID=A0AA36J1J3_9DINO|nr:unnamed protein product [Effrenium voratum]
MLELCAGVVIGVVLGIILSQDGCVARVARIGLGASRTGRLLRMGYFSWEAFDLKTLKSALRLLVEYRMDKAYETPEAKRQLGEKVKQTLLDAGGIFPKVAQNLAERPEIFPDAEVREKLKECQAKCPHMPLAELRQAYKKLHPDSDRACLHKVDPVPLGSASIGQVHRLSDRSKVLKIVNPLQRAKVTGQEALVTALADFLEGEVSGGPARSVALVLREAFKEVLKEFDLTQEADNMKRVGFANCTLHGIQISVPEVCQSIPSTFTLRMENIFHTPGLEAAQTVKLDEVLQSRFVHHALKTQILKALIQHFGQQLVVEKAAHCDPHPGNIYVQLVHGEQGVRVGRMWLLDWGSLLLLSDEQHAAFAQLLAVASCKRCKSPKSCKSPRSPRSSPPARSPSALPAVERFEAAFGIRFEDALSFEERYASKAEALAVPKMSSAAVQILRIMNALGSYLAMVQDNGMDTNTRTEMVWWDELQRSTQEHSMESAEEETAEEETAEEEFAEEESSATDASAHSAHSADSAHSAHAPVSTVTPAACMNESVQVAAYLPSFPIQEFADPHNIARQVWNAVNISLSLKSTSLDHFIFVADCHSEASLQDLHGLDLYYDVNDVDVQIKFVLGDAPMLPAHSEALSTWRAASNAPVQNSSNEAFEVPEFPPWWPK